MDEEKNETTPSTVEEVTTETSIPPEAVAAGLPKPPEPALVPTSAAEWRRKARQAWLVLLPSGITVKTKRPQWSSLITSGVIQVDDFLRVSGAVGETDAMTPGERVRARSQATIALAELVLPHIVLSPQIVPKNGGMHDLDDDVMGIEDIEDNDKTSLVWWAMGLMGLPERAAD